MAKLTQGQYAQKILKSKGPIVVDNALMCGLGYDNTRDFFRELGDWGHITDFNTIPASADDKVQVYLRAFIKTFID